MIGQCPNCKRNTVELSIDPRMKKGLSHEILLSCTCLWSYSLFSSNRIDNTENKSSFDINLRTIVAFREFGQGLQSIDIFCRLMNISPPMTNFAYSEIINKIHPLYIQAAEKSMSDASAAVRINDDITNIVASLDGSWQRRGYASLNGVVTCLERENDKCIDVEVKVKDCKSCVYWEKHRNTPAYTIWKESHVCNINHVGSASSMETTEIVSIFKRSVEKQNCDTLHLLVMETLLPIQLCLKKVPTLVLLWPKVNELDMYRSKLVVTYEKLEKSHPKTTVN